MNQELFSSAYEKVHFVPGLMAATALPRLPQATALHAKLTYGSIQLQEFATPEFLFRYFVFSFLRPITLICPERETGLQLYLTLKGSLKLGVKGWHRQHLEEGQYTMVDAGEAATEAIVLPGQECHLVNTLYTSSTYSDWFSLFPSFEAAVQQAQSRPVVFLPAPRPLRPGLLEVVRSVLQERYSPELQQYFWNLKLRELLFRQLAQTYATPDERTATAAERELAEGARAIIAADLSRHFANDELARLLHASESTLKRAFRAHFGMGMYEYLRRLRMERARELLLAGEPVKTVAPAIGMRPSNFTIEFQKFFGYKTSALKRQPPR